MWVNNKAMRAPYEPTLQKAMDMLLYILVEDRNKKTILPNYFKGREPEMIKLLAGHGVKVRVYERYCEKYVEKEVE